MSEWQPIESAPRDGRKIILFYINRAKRGRTVFASWLTEERANDIDAEGVDLGEGWYERIDNWPDYTHIAIHEGEPTHWMPLPPPPAQGEDDMSCPHGELRRECERCDDADTIERLRARVAELEARRVEWVIEEPPYTQRHSCTIEEAATQLAELYNEWPCGVEESLASVKGFRHRVAELEAERDALMMNPALKQIQALQAENAALREDAERYRWMRSSDVGPSSIWELVSDDAHPPYMTLKCGNELDAAIDAARRAT